MSKNYKMIIAVMLFLSVITAFFYLLIVGIKSDYSPAMTMEEIRQADLSTTLVPIGPTLCDWYPEKLLLPEDFTKKEPASGGRKAMYGTYRMLLPLPAGRTYGISGLTCSYAQKVYVNGVLLSEVGRVADNAADFVPRTDSYSIFFTPETDETEIIVQLAHWNNKNGYFNQVYLAEQELVIAMNRSNFLASGLIVGTLFAFAVFFFGMFLFYHDKRHLLYFALMCFFSGMYFFIFQNKDIMALLPNLPWSLSHKIEYLSQLATYMLLIVYTVSVTKLKIGKWQKTGFFAPVGAVMLYYIIAPSTFYSYHKTLPMGIYAHTIAFGAVYVLYRSVHDKLYRQKENYLVLLSLLVGVGVYIFDFITDRNYNVMPFGTMLTVFFNAIAITIRFSHAEQELNLAQLREKEISETNAMLFRMSELRTEFFNNIAHEMGTPLTVMSGYAELSAIEIQKGKVTDKTLRNLQTVSSEALRLSDMVTRLKDVTLKKAFSPKCVRLEPRALLYNAVSICSPILQKNDNRLELSVDTQKPIYGNMEALLQVFVNLAVNANRHTKQGTIRFCVSDGDSFVIFRVENNGEKISPEIVPHIFEQGVSGDGGSGLGLAICRSILKQCGGDIRLDYSTEEGTSFSFFTPVYEEGEHE